MTFLTFEEIHAIADAHYGRESNENAPLARACRALDTIRTALSEVCQDDQEEIIDGLYDLLVEYDGVTHGQ